MRLSSLLLGLAALACATPAWPQTPLPGLNGSPGASETHPPLAASVARPTKASIEADRRLLAEQKRLERIMTICTGC